MTARRARLPNRRPSVVETIEWQGAAWQLGVGFDAAGAVREVFLDGPKIGSEAEALLDDGCILLSLLLQHGVSAAALDGHLGREGVEAAALAASPLGLIAARIAVLEGEEGPGQAAAAALRSQAATYGRTAPQ